MRAIIGGTGLADLAGLEIREQKIVDTPFGAPSNALIMGRWQGQEIVFLPRHGENHTIAPHKINYRANMWALREVGVTQIVAIAADLAPGAVAIPEQIIDYTYGREQSCYSDDFSADKHIDFTFPYTESLRQQLLKAAKQVDIPLIDGGIYGATQGPRLETAAEIQGMAKEGCTMVGMTGMPEAYLARELEMDYACCAVVANWAAGLGKGDISMAEMATVLGSGMEKVRCILNQYLSENKIV